MNTNRAELWDTLDGKLITSYSFLDDAYRDIYLGILEYGEDLWINTSLIFIVDEEIDWAIEGTELINRVRELYNG